MANQKKSTPALSEDEVNKIRKEKLQKLKRDKLGDTSTLPAILDKLDEKERAYVEARVNGVAKPKAAEIAKPDTPFPNSYCQSMEERPLVREALMLSFQEASLDSLALAMAFKGGLTANIPYYDKKKGKIVESAVPDHKRRVDTASKIAEIAGLKVPKEDPGGKHLHIHLNKEESEKMEKGVLAHLQQEYGKKD